MTMAHLGLAFAVAGITGAGAWKVESVQTMKQGDTVNVAGYEFRFDGAEQGRGPNYLLTRAKFTVSRDGDFVAVLEPEKRIYPVRQMPTTEAGIHTLLSGDLYAVIGDPKGDGFVTRIYFKPIGGVDVDWRIGDVGGRFAEFVRSALPGSARRRDHPDMRPRSRRNEFVFMNRLVFLLPLLVLLVIGGYLAVGLTLDPKKLPSMLEGGPVPAFNLAPA